MKTNAKDRALEIGTFCFCCLPQWDALEPYIRLTMPELKKSLDKHRPSRTSKRNVIRVRRAQKGQPT
jgi:hypothetical protein